MTVMERVLEEKVIAIVRGLEPESMQGLCDALLEGGIRLVEVTFDQSRPQSWADTAQAIADMGRRYGGDILPGAGTVIRPEQVELAYQAGAKYLVTPTADTQIIRQGKALGLCMFPGALTPTEIAAAHAAGADAVKVFPAGALGPGYLKAVRAPLSHIPLMAVGGVDEKNAADYLAAGAVAIGVGGNLVNKQWIAQGEWERITALARAYREAAST